MKTTSIFLVAILTLFGCSDKEIKEFRAHLKIYKTNADYFDYVNIRGDSNPRQADNISIISSMRFENGDTTFCCRWRLEQGYVADYTETWHTDYFTDISFKEMLKYNESFGLFPIDIIKKRITDKDPFVEFYIDDQLLFYRMQPEDIEQLNEIIRNGELEKYLKREK